jgi:SHS2 domain-containing protein
MALPPFEVIGHTADLRLKVRGRNQEELFRNALKGLGAIMKSGVTARDISRPFAVSAPDETALLVDFLNEALYLANVNKEVYNDVMFHVLDEMHCEGELIGAAVEEFDEDIKAVTYHEAEIIVKPDGFREVTLTFDI